ncbi:DNA polymerase/3'-5' exonuclease PolX [Kushneria marisflavi]|uniref:DNA polymerase beta n=1 Tax=Kushneria marisflavi TaxID=157779 RepID=A0A240UPT2_9GAMM|nr:DNA polymerase/3'-5' exonuclease PolX [Kushneria marisflavi]ART63494.1 DNA polymerase III [Kushneria marisflavi]RKD84561.1 DNA polymerase (family 10) [Kushneria marisflavi]
MQNADIARTLNRLANMLDIEGANAFRVRAYRSAAQTIESHPRALQEMVALDEPLTELAGIGQDLAKKITELINTGRLTVLEEAEKRLPPGLLQLMRVSQLGPRRVRQLHEALGIDNLEALKKAALEGRIRALEGFGEKTEAGILKEAERLDDAPPRTRLDEAHQAADDLIAWLEHARGAQRISAAGSLRRGRETVGDLDILVSSEDGPTIMTHLMDYPEIAEVVSHGKTKSTLRLHSGLQVDVRVVADESFGAALYYFTGSQAHNIATRKMATDRGLKINEYGIYKGRQRLAGRTEEEVLARIDLAWIPPELRENSGELEAALEGTLPELVTLDDIRGDLHMHTTASDGKAGLEDMVHAARRRGYRYIAITDHSQRLAMANGLDARRLREQMAEIDALNERLKNFTVLKGNEVDILEDGSLDLPDDVLKELDVCVFSVHSKFNLSREQQTARILRAMDNPHVNILAHPTGRIINGREGHEVDIEAVLRGAKERGIFLEINAQPARLDLADRWARMARDIGVMLAISTDAHATDQLGHMALGVTQARRGWLERKDVLNTRTVTQLRKLMRR